MLKLKPADGFLTGILGPDFRWAVTASNDSSVEQELSDQGFYVVDTRVTLEKKQPFDFPVLSPEGYSIREALPNDENQVVAIAASSFSCSRFHNDPAISKILANKVKKEWARNFFRGKRGDAMIVAVQDEKIVGFNLLLIKKDILIIDLIAVDAAHRQRGLASAMVTAAAATPGINLMRVGTQLLNIPSLRAYEKIGFAVIDTEHVWHCHTAVV